MILSALKVKLAALVAVAGIDTSDFQNPSAELVGTLEKLASEQAAAQKAAQEKASGPDVNKAFNDALSKINELASKNDKDAQYVLAHWGVLTGSNVNSIVELLRKAATQGQVVAKVELAQVLLQAFQQDLERAREAVKLIEEAEAANNKLARRLLANLHLNGSPNVGITQDSAKALALLEKGSTDGDGEATLGISQIYSVGVPGIAKDDLKALDYLKKAGEQKNAVALSQYAARLFDGDPVTGSSKPLVEKDPAKAMRLFEDAANSGFAAANRLLGAIYENGLGGNKQDLKKALDYYTKAANGNDGTALFRLGNFFEVGLRNGSDEKAEVLVQPNSKSALDLYRLAAQNGSAEAFFNVGVYYETGNVVDKDLTKAFGFLMKAATNGIPQAQHRLASLYQQGGGTNQDPVAALSWFQRAASAGYTPSQVALGLMFENGIGLNGPNFEAAAMQYEAAAEQGDAVALLRLATLNERGLANIKENKPNPNLPRALAYADLAVDAAAQAPQAPQFAQYRDELKKRLKPEEVTEAGKIYEEYKKKNTKAPAASAPEGSGSSKGDSKKKAGRSK
jgi:TPR repeat protein